MIATALIHSQPVLPLPLLLAGVAVAAFALIAPFWWFAAAAAVSAYSSIVSSRMAAAANREAAKISELQGDIAVIQSEFQAKMALKAGREQASYIRQQSAEVVGTQVTRTASAGVELSGSPMMAIAQEIWAGEKAAAGTLKNAIARSGQIEAAGVAARVQGDANAANLRQAADYGERAGVLNAVAKGVTAYAMYEKTTGGSTGGNPLDYLFQD